MCSVILWIFSLSLSSQFNAIQFFIHQKKTRESDECQWTLCNRRHNWCRQPNVWTRIYRLCKLNMYCFDAIFVLIIADIISLLAKSDLETKKPQTKKHNRNTRNNTNISKREMNAFHPWHHTWLVHFFFFRMLRRRQFLVLFIIYWPIWFLEDRRKNTRQWLSSVYL